MLCKARKSLEKSFFHIMVQGINKDYICNDADYKDKYIEILNRYENECDIQILSYEQKS